jgi:dipeptidyl aminopeptidase/acylaminoacyl peptidase
VRHVTLPDAAHGYSARESIEDVLDEMLPRFDEFVKNAGPREMHAKAASKAPP